MPEKEELTEGGWLFEASRTGLLCKLRLKSEGIRVSFFVDADKDDLSAASEIGADIVELHTGRFCDLPSGSARQIEYERIISARFAHDCELEVHAGRALV